MKMPAAVCGLLLVTACKASAPAESVQQLMKNKVDPASKVYFEAVQYVSDETGQHDIQPRTDADWEKVRKAAADLQDYARRYIVGKPRVTGVMIDPRARAQIRLQESDLMPAGVSR